MISYTDEVENGYPIITVLPMDGGASSWDTIVSLMNTLENCKHVQSGVTKGDRKKLVA